MTTADPLSRAVRALDEGALVVYPTDTLLGLGARVDRPGAVRKLIRTKGRPSHAPLSFACSSYEELEPWADLDALSRSQMRRLLPGPYTLLLRANVRGLRRLPPAVLGPGGTIGVRIPDHPVARALARRAGPIVSTSANRHGARPARSILQARRYFGSSVAVYLPARPAPLGRPSEIIDLTGAVARPVPRP